MCRVVGLTVRLRTGFEEVLVARSIGAKHISFNVKSDGRHRLQLVR